MVTMQNKKGVSLVTVLMFMLVATIAATATYKWLTSAGRSSAARMLENQAYQSAVAGLENARTWMTYHASDVGALIKQYVDDGKPILLNSRLKELTRGGQEFDIWLVGVNTENSTYKLKLLSSGKSRNNTEYNLVSIFNVDGLYQAKVPNLDDSSTTSFDYAYYGGSYSGAGAVSLTSGVINGNWSGNPQSVTGNLVVTGNATLSGNNVSLGKLACIGGDAKIENNGITATDLYVGGTMKNAAVTVSGDAYFDSDTVFQGNAGSFIINGNATFNGCFKTAQNEKSPTIMGNMCLSDTGSIWSNGTNYAFTVNGNVWMPGANNLVYGNYGDNSSNYGKIVLGADAASEVYYLAGHASSEFSTLKTAKTFTENSTYRKYCGENFQKDGKWTWGQMGYTFTFTGTGDYNICGTQIVSQAGSYPGYYSGYGTYYTVYVDGWKKWGGASYSPYGQSISSKSDMYYSYYVEPGVEDVEFKEYDNSYWWYYTGSETLSPSGRYWLPLDRTEFKNRFSSPTPIGAYFVGGQLFFDSYSEYNYYHYTGSTPTSSPYCVKSSSNSYRPVCYVTNFFKSNGTVINSLPAEAPFECASSVKESCDALWTEGTGCDGSKYVVKDPLVTGIDNFRAYANKGCAANIKSWNTSLVKSLNACYKENYDDETKRDQNLFNDFLVVEVSGGEGEESCPSGTLDGKFIIIKNGSLSCQNGLPSTTSDSYVFLYLKDGASRIGSTVNHYFIYTEGQIGNADNLKLTGTIYSPASNCKGIDKMQSATLTMDQELLNVLSKASVICDNDGSTVCGTSSSSDDDDSDEDSGSDSTAGSNDKYYVSNAPTLSITIESQYKTTETLPTTSSAADIDGDFVVVPRVIYITTDPYGELDDYYNVLGLNGLSLKKSDGQVSCKGPSTLRTSGSIYNRNGSDSKLTRGRYTCTFTYGSKSVPFYVIASGETGDDPFVNFTESNVEMASTSSYEVKVTVPAHTDLITLNVYRPGDISGWTITASGSGSCTSNLCTFSIPANASSTDVTLFDVTTSSAGNGTAMFQLASGEGYVVGSPATEVLTISSSVTVNRVEVSNDAVTAYCAEHASDCPADRSSWPDCNLSTSWVLATPGCNTTNVNEQWTCGVTADISLAATGDGDGCVVIIPEEKIEQASLVIGNTYELPASAKARLMKFYFGFSGEDLSGESIVAKITESSVSGREGKSSTCTYGSDVASTSSYCSLDVFYDEKVEVSISGATRPDNFNYWECQGSGCPVEINSGETFDAFTITSDGNVVIAHYNETDKHCFFDEFKAGLDCSDDKYCIGSTSSKWRTTETSKIDYQDGYVSAKINKSDKTGVVVMSTVEPGKNGTLKAQFQVPQVASGDASAIPATVRNSGFVLYSNYEGSSYLLLSFYADKSGHLTARLCDNLSAKCYTQNFESGSSPLSISSSTVVTISATTGDVLNISAMTNRFGASVVYTASFDVASNFSAYTSSSYIGFRLADPNFKIYDMGWKSDDYGSECWDTYPTVNCSFKAAYAGGVVPLSTDATPWVGLSSWFDASGCVPHYYYKGDDANCGSTLTYGECLGAYRFTETGSHGYVDASNVEQKMAKAGAGSCTNLTDSEMLLAETEWASCGKFWVGELSYCKQHAYFAGNGSPNDSRTVSNGTTENFNLASGEYVNIREATLMVNLENTSASTVEIYLLSQRDSYSPVAYSKSFETSSSGVISIDVEQLLDADAFNPQNVYGVAVHVSGSSSVKVNAIYTSCPNVVSLSCGQNMSYDATAKKWRLTADVTNFSQVKSFTVKEGNSYVSQVDYDCESSGCSLSQNGKIGTYSFAIDDNPYESHTGEPYSFEVTMDTKDGGASMTCTTNSVEIPPIQAVCGNISLSSVKSGNGLPIFNYSISNCPSTGCPYKITLQDLGTDIYTGSGNNANGNTPSDGANTSTDPLVVGTYKFKLESTDNGTPFTSCESESFTVKSVASDLNITCGVSKNNNSLSDGSGSGVEFYTTDKLYFVAQNQDRVEDKISVSVTKNGATDGSGEISDWSNWSTLKDIGTLAVGSYKYSVVFAGEEVCSHTATIKDVSDEVTATCSDVTTFPDQSVSNYVSVDGLSNVESSTRLVKIDGTEMSKSTNCNKSYCEPMTSFKAPKSEGTYTYKFYFNDVEKCSGEITVSSVLVCSASSTEVKLGESFDFTATYGGSCYSSNISGNGVSTNNCQMSYKITPTTTGEQSYTYSVTGGSVGTGYCTVKVNVVEEKPAVTCPTSAYEVAVGGSVTMTPVSITGCSAGGCNYTIKKGSNVPVNVTDKSYKSGATKSFTPSESGTYTFTVSNTAGDASCDFSVGYKKPSVSCSGTYSVEPGATVSFTPTVENCDNGCLDTLRLGDSKITGSSYTGGQISFTSEKKKGTQTYTFVVANSAGSDNCSIDVEYKDPVVTCPESYSVEPGTNVSFTPTSLSYCTNGCKYSLVYDYTNKSQKSIEDYSYTNPSSIEFTRDKNLTSAGYTFTVTNQAGASAKCSFDVNDLVPTFSCPADMTKAVDATVSVTPTNVANCTKGCNYTISGGSHSDVAVTDYSYTEGSLASITGESSAGTQTYTLKIANSAGWDEKNCQFDVEYTATSCSESNAIITESNSNGNISVSLANNKCGKYYTKKSCKHAQVQASGSSGSGTFTINGKEFSCATYTDTDIPVASTIKIEASSTCAVSGSIYVSGCGTPKASCSVDNTSISSTETTTFRASSFEYADVSSWILKKDGTQIASGGSTTSIAEQITGYGTYDLYLNGESTAICSKKIKNKDDTSVISVVASYQGYIAYSSGNTYEVTMAGGGVFRCTYDSQSSAVTIGTFNGTSFGASAYQSQATAANPGSGSIVKFVVEDDISGSLKCANDW